MPAQQFNVADLERFSASAKSALDLVVAATGAGDPCTVDGGTAEGLTPIREVALYFRYCRDSLAVIQTDCRALHDGVAQVAEYVRALDDDFL